VAHKSHLGERSNDLKRLPTASCRQCQASALAFGGLVPALFSCTLVMGRRWADSGAAILALASRQDRLGSLIVSGLVDGASTDTACTAGIIPGSAWMSGNASLSDFADSFGTDAMAILL